MTDSAMTRGRTILALVIACVMTAFFVQPAEAQTAKKLKCKGCVKSKQLKNGGIKSKDIQDGAVGNADLSSKAVTLDKLGDDVAALGLSGVAVVPASAFTERRTTDPGSFTFFDNGYIRADDNDLKCVIAPVHLPDGVVLTEMELIHSDGSTSDLEVGLRRKSLTVPGVAEEIASVTTSGDTGGIDDLQSVSTTTFTETAVDAVNSYHYVETCLETTGLRLIAVRIFYN